MRSIQQAVADALAHVGKPDIGGSGRCQEAVRTWYGLPAWAPSAADACRKTPADQKHPVKDPRDVPLGAIVYFPTMGPFGHVVLAVGDGLCVSNDYVRQGYYCKASLALPNWHGMTHDPCWSLWTPYGIAH